MSDVKRPLNRTVSIVCALFISLLCIILSAATYRLYTRTMYERYEKQLSSILNYVEAQIDHDDMAECARTYVESEKYKEFQVFFDELIDHYEDVHYLYIMQVNDPDAKSEIAEICAANSSYEKEFEPDLVMHLGDAEEGWYDKETAQRFRDALQGDVDTVVVNVSEWGADYTLARPLITSTGEHYGLLCADISIDQINETIYRNIYITLAMIILPGILFIFLLILWMRKNVTGPLKQLENSVTAFAKSSTGRRDPDDLLFTPPEIHTQNEVESLSNAITKLSGDMRDYVREIIEVKNAAKGLQVHVTEMNAIVYRDELTHVKNRTAFNKTAKKLDEDIENGRAQFALVMADLNSLKEINDKYGHDKGNEYIVGSCGLICNVYDHSPVFRVGGDEFVVLLQGEDYRQRDALLTRIRGEFSQYECAGGLSPWKSYSAAVGMAVYEPGDTVDAVFSRADQEMYRDKMKIKGTT